MTSNCCLSGPKDIVGVDPVRQVFFLSLSFGHYSDLHMGLSVLEFRSCS